MLRKVLPLLGVSSLGFLFLLMTGCGGSSGSGFASLSVSVHASATKVDGAGTNSITLSATVTNDSTASGVSWTATAGTLSAKTSASGATITFTPPASTSSVQSITVTAISAADSSRSGKATITVPAMLTVTNTDTTALNGSVGAAYSVQLVGSGGIPPYENWAVAPGSTLPSCLTLNASTGVITFTSKTVQAACAAGSPYDPAFTFTDSGTPTALTGTTPDYVITITAAPALVLPSATVPAAGTAGAAYSGSVQGQGGAGTLTYTRTSGALPTGLTLDANSGAITGTADKAGTYDFTVELSDGYGDTPASQSYSLIINPAPVSKFAAAGPANSTAGTAFSLTLTAEDAYGNTITSYGGTVSFTSTDTSAVLPASYTFTPTDNGKRLISGFKLETAGNQTVTATDGGGITGSAAVDVSTAALSQFGVTASTTAPVAGRALQRNGDSRGSLRQHDYELFRDGTLYLLRHQLERGSARGLRLPGRRFRCPRLYRRETGKGGCERTINQGGRLNRLYDQWNGHP